MTVRRAGDKPKRAAPRKRSKTAGQTRKRGAAKHAAAKKATAPRPKAPEHALPVLPPPSATPVTHTITSRQAGPQEQPPSAGPNCPHIVDTLGAVAKHFGIAAGTLKHWRRDGMPGRTGHYDLVDIWHWRWSRRGGEVELDEHGLPRAKSWKDERDKLAVLQLRGELVPRAEHEAALVARSEWLHNVLLVLPARLAPLVAGQSETDVRALLNTEITGLIESIYGRRELPPAGALPAARE